MKISKTEILGAAGIAVGITSSVIGLSTAGASAASLSSSSQSSSSITRSVARKDKLQAMADVLSMTTSQVQAHLKTHDLKQVVADKGLSTDTFRQKVQADLMGELQAQGYSQTQIDTALQHHQRHS